MGSTLLVQLAGHWCCWQTRICLFFALFAPRQGFSAKPNQVAAENQGSPWREPAGASDIPCMGSAAVASDGRRQCSSRPFLSSLSYSSELRPRSRSWPKLSVSFSISSWVALQGNTSPIAAHTSPYSYIGCSSTCFALRPAASTEL